MIPSAPPRNIELNLPYILNPLQEFGLNDLDMAVVSLATVAAETLEFKPTSERQSRFNTSPGGLPFDLYDHRRDLGNDAEGDGQRFRGRGFIEMTGRFNYASASKALNLNLLQNPEQALDPETAARVLARSLKSSEALIRSAIKNGDFILIRRSLVGGESGLNTFAYAYKTARAELQLQ